MIHDPSGVHVFSHLAEDVAAFATAYRGDVDFVQLAVTPEQAHDLALKSAPPKATDRRAFDGDETYQAEAIDPADLAQIVANALPHASTDPPMTSCSRPNRMPVLKYWLGSICNNQPTGQTVIEAVRSG